MIRLGLTLTMGGAALFAAIATAAAQPRRTSEILRSGDIAIETYVDGSPLAPVIVMLPSTGRDGAEDFDDVAGRLAAAGFRVLRPQPRGIGASTGPMEGVSLHGLADDVALVIERLGGGRAVIVGHAFGHFVARMVAVDHPNLVRGVVLAAAAASTYAPEVAAAPGKIANPATSDAERLATLEMAFFAPGHDAQAWLHGWYPKVQRMQADSREKQGVQQSDWWSAGAAPLLELIPAADPFKPSDKWGEMKESYGERVTTVMIPDASHALFPEQPAAVAGAIVAWVRTLPP